MYPNGFDAPFARSIYTERYEHPDDVNWTGTTRRVVGTTTGALFTAPKAQSHINDILDLQDRLCDLVGNRKFCPGGRYLYSCGRPKHQTNNCMLMRCEDSREGWGQCSKDSEMALMLGAGIGVWYGDLRPEGAPISSTGGTSGGPMSKMNMINDIARRVLSGGNRRGAVWAGLPWWHADIFEFIVAKDWPEEIKKMKAEFVEGEREKDIPAEMDTTNVSVTLDDDFFECFFDGMAEARYEPYAPDGDSWHSWAHRVYYFACEHMTLHGEPGFTVDTGDKRAEVLRNACTEVTSADNNDVCNLGSLVLPRFTSLTEWEAGVQDAVRFLTAGSIYSDLPYPEVEAVRQKNRRLGLGIMGVHEFLLKRGLKYGSDNACEALMPYMEIYERALEYAREFQDSLGLSPSIAATAIAPNGTIGALMETTPGSDAMFSAAEIRRVKTSRGNNDTFVDHVVVDPTAARLVREGVDPDSIEDAYTLSYDVERRFRQQAFLQEYVDHAISGTVNIPAPLTDHHEAREFADHLLRWLPKMRGITVYPDGARAGQPRTTCNLAWALENEGTTFEANLESCAGGVCAA